MRKIIDRLKKEHKTISTMESCTGGGFVNYITNFIGASEVLKFSAVTYSNDYKIKMGVSKHVIDKYSVYSIETAREMSKNICFYSDANYGIGITGKLNRIDKNNMYGMDNKVYISIYDRDNDKFYDFDIFVVKNSRVDNKEEVINFLREKLLEIL
jgi:PncC family amidohydrolase